MSSKIVMHIVKICATIMILVIIFAGVVYFGRGTYDFGYRIFAEPAMTTIGNGVEVTVQITEGMSNREIAKLIERKGLCRSANLFWVQLELSDYRKSIKPGMYVLKTDMTADQILVLIGSDANEE